MGVRGGSEGVEKGGLRTMDAASCYRMMVVTPYEATLFLENLIISFLSFSGDWSVVCTLAVTGRGGPVKASEVMFLCFYSPLPGSFHLDAERCPSISIKVGITHLDVN
eukprot:1164981-Prorocentrum_minimum.AAC.2